MFEEEGFEKVAGAESEVGGAKRVLMRVDGASSLTSNCAITAAAGNIGLCSRGYGAIGSASALQAEG